MTRIKCRYSIPYCYCLFPGQSEERVYHSKAWWCDSNEECPYGKYEKPKDPNPMYVNPICVHCKCESGEFEKVVESYEYFEGGDLIIEGETYEAYDIGYLEIDGRVLVGEETAP